jgi:uncharacterized membrane protein
LTVRPDGWTLDPMRREAVWEYLRGALWALPTLSVLLALIVGYALSSIEVSASSPLVFQGTADDARTLLIAIASTMATVIALVLGLTVVALQLSSTQFSPRLLRNFLRDRLNQIVLSVFVATFTYSTAGLYTVGVESGQRVDEFPRLAVSGALVLLFGSLVMLVFFVHHLMHSIQIDEVMRNVERNTLRVIGRDLPTDGIIAGPVVVPPDDAVEIPAHRSGWVQTVHPEVLLPPARAAGGVVACTTMVGEYVVAGTPLLRIWKGTPDPEPFHAVLRYAVRIGFERTAEQDVAFGIRQLADIAVKALSPAINDPYTAIQSLEHIGVVLASLAPRPLGGQLLSDPDGSPRVWMPGRDLRYYLDLATGQIRRYGGSEPRVALALIRVLRTTARFCRDDAGRSLVAEQIHLVLEAAELGIRQQADLEPIRAAAARALSAIS